MKKLTFVLTVLVILVVGVGFSRGWFALSNQSQDTESNKTDINLTVDRGKVKEDVQEMKDKTAELAHKTSAEAKDLGDQARDKVKSK
jgi:major membrane immunogen (membrane-anchored lipoprotein)